MIYWVLIWSVVLFIMLPMETMLSFGVSTDNMLAGSLTYMYMHASWLHLAINVITLCAMWFPIRKLYTIRYNSETYVFNAATYLSAIIAGAACATDIPTVGMSGMVYFLLGALIVLNPSREQLISYIPIAIIIIIQSIFGHSNVALHLFAFTEGVIYMAFRELIHQHRNGTGLFAPQC